jgi:hypothetical protein
MSGFVSSVLLCLLFGIVLPGAGDLFIPQSPFSLLDIPDNGAVVVPTLTDRSRAATR